MKKSSVSNIILMVVIILLIIPQTRKPIQVFLHKGLAMFSPNIISEEKRKNLGNYNWQLQSLNGAAYNLSLARDKVVFVNLWATWCPPCIAEMPSIQKLYNDYNDKVEILLISDEKEDIIQRFLNKHEYTFIVYRPASNIPKELYSRSIPKTYIIDKKGNIIINKEGAANWNSDSIRALLDSLISE